MTPADAPRRVHVLTALLLVGTFAAGVVTGAGVLRWAAPAAPRPEGAAAVAPPLPAARLPRELRLTPEQEARAREIGERYRPELEALARELKPRIRAVQDRMEGEFLALLTEEQKAQLARIEERRKNPPRDGEPPGEPPPPTHPGGVRQRGADEAPRAAGRPPPPQEAIDACVHLDLDQLCRFAKDGREHEGSCRRMPGGEGPLHCAPDRHMDAAPPGDRPPRR